MRRRYTISLPGAMESEAITDALQTVINTDEVRYKNTLNGKTGNEVIKLRGGYISGRYIDHEQQLTAEDAQRIYDAVLADLFRRKGVTKNADALGLNAAQVFRVTATEYIRLYDQVPEALDMLKKHGYRLWLLSNAQRAFTAYELRAMGLTERFDGILLSSDYQCRKPDLRFFRALLDENGLDPRACLMIGNDRDTDIAGARAAGIATLYMHTNLTPHEQAPADPACAFAGLSRLVRHAEFEGADWQVLADLLLH